MKKTSIFLLAALALAGCTKSDYLGTVAPEANDGSIGFGFNMPNSYKAPARKANKNGVDAATALGNQFVVWGEKSEADGSAAGAGNLVFQNYKVEYTAGTANTTASNTADWEYVGLTPYTETQVSPALTAQQTIKYWDYTASNYVFNAFSALKADLEGGQIVVAKTQSDAASKYNKGYSLLINDGAHLENLYFADRLPIAKSTSTSGTNTYGGVVTLNFRTAAAKVRFGVYETVPGYQVRITKVYFTDNATEAETTSETNFAIDGGFTVVGGTPATMNVVYYPNGSTNAAGASIENQPKVTIAGGTPQKSMTFGTTNVGDEVLGTTAPTATFDNNGEYTIILPNISNDKPMKLKIDYLLTSTDGSNETIKVSHATATVPAEYCQWTSNFAYTYLFKISDNTNGSTGTPDTDPAGLYPITFDAVVVDAETGNQETITTVAEPSITTYANGRVFTEDEYRIDNDVYVAVMKGAAVQALTTTNAKVYRAYKMGTQEITEAALQHYTDYSIVLEPVSTADNEMQEVATHDVPMADGSTKSISTLKFTPKGGIYVFEYTYEEGTPAVTKKAYKVIKCTGAAIGHTYAWGTAITIDDATALTKTITLKDNDLEVIGAEKKIAVSVKTQGAVGTASAADLTIKESATAGTYNVTLTDAALKSGAAAGTTYTLTYDGATVDVTVASTINTLNKTAVTIYGGENDATITLKDNSGNAVSGVISAVDSRLEVTETTGAYTVAVKAGATAGDATFKIAGQTVTVAIKAYTLTATNATVEKAEGANATVAFTLKDAEAAGKTGATGFVITKDGASVTPTVTEGTSGAYSFEATAGGVYTISYNGYTTQVTVNAYGLTLSQASISTKNGTTTATLKNNGAIVECAKANVTILDGTSADVTSSFAVTQSGKGLVIGRNNVAAGTYTVKYTVGGVVVATATLTTTGTF